MYQYLRLDVNCQWMDVATLITNHIAQSYPVTRAYRAALGRPLRAYLRMLSLVL